MFSFSGIFDSVVDFVTEDIPYAISSAAEWVDDTIFGYGNDVTSTMYTSGPFPGINQAEAGSYLTTTFDYGPLEKGVDYLFGLEGGPYSSSLLQDLGGFSNVSSKVGKAVSAGAESFLGGSKGATSAGSAGQRPGVDVPAGTVASGLSGLSSSDPRIQQATANMLRGEFVNPEIRAVLEAALARRTIQAYGPTISPGSASVRVDLAKKVK